MLLNHLWPNKQHQIITRPGFLQMLFDAHDVGRIECLYTYTLQGCRVLWHIEKIAFRDEGHLKVHLTQQQHQVKGCNGASILIRCRRAMIQNQNSPARTPVFSRSEEHTSELQ